MGQRKREYVASVFTYGSEAPEDLRGWLNEATEVKSVQTALMCRANQRGPDEEEGLEFYYVLDRVLVQYLSYCMLID